MQSIRTPRRGWRPAKVTDSTEVESDELQGMVVEETTDTSINEEEKLLVEIIESESDTRIETKEIDTNSKENQETYTQENVYIDINVCEIKNVLISVNETKWSDSSLENVSSYLQSAEQMSKLTMKELIELTKYTNEQMKDKSITLKTSSAVRKHELVNNLSSIIGDGSTTEARKRKKKTPDSLKQLAHRAIMRQTYPKLVLTVAYCNFKWSEDLHSWYEKSRVSNEITIEGIEEVLHPYYVPDETKNGDFEVFVYDKTHLGSNLRKCLCLNKVHGISIEAWKAVATSNPEILHPLVIEVSEDGKIQDQMKEAYSRNMFSYEVETKMMSNGDVIEAMFCNIIREGLYEAEDKPGISAKKRCLNRMRLIHWLNTDVNFGDFPPHGSTIKGMSNILYEGLRSSTEAKLYLYALAKKGTYNVRSPNTLCSESFFSSMQEMDPWGQGVLSADGIEKHISDFTTLTALKMNDNKSFSINTKKGKMYPVPKADTIEDNQNGENVETCCCRENRFIKCIIPRNHFFDTKQRARSEKKYDKPVKFASYNEPLRGDLPIRSRF